MLRTENLNAGYKELHVLFDVNTTFEDNKITAIVGPNGSGKSTLLKSIFGLATIHSGKIIFGEKDITNVPPHDKTKLGIAYLPQVDNVFTNLTVEENLKIAGYTVEENEFENRFETALEVFPTLKNYLKKRAGTLSGGERQFLAISTALIRKAKILMLDEPTAQLAPKFAEEIFEKIIELRDKFKLTLILVEQNIKRALEISDRAYFLISGRIVFSGRADELLQHEKFADFCLGIA